MSTADATIVEDTSIKPSDPSLLLSVRKTTGSGSERIHYLDNVRAIAMLLGVVLHAALTYAEPARNFWIVADKNGSSFLDGLMGFLHLFRLPLFFFVAGYFAKLLVARRGITGFLKNRGIRIVLPFLVFYIPLVIAMTVGIIFAIQYCNHLPPMMEAAKAAAASGAQQEPPPLTTMHMWFLYYLAMFSLVAAIACNFKSKRLSNFFNWFYSGLWPILFAPLLLPSLFGAGVGIPAPESFTPQLWPFGFYGLYFFAGWHMFGREQFVESVKRFALPLLAISLCLYVVLRQMTVSEIPLPPQTVSTSQLIIPQALTAIISISMVVASLVLGKQFLSMPSKSLRYISDASYWIYLVHLPILLILQIAISNLEWNIWLKFLVSTTGTFAISIALYAVFVRYTPIGWMLNGRKKFPWHLFKRTVIATPK